MDIFCMIVSVVCLAVNVTCLILFNSAINKGVAEFEEIEKKYAEVE